jgi:hypothetical protein
MNIFKNIVLAIIKAIRLVFRGKSIIVTTYERTKRLEICTKCPFQHEGRCLHCGCYLGAKTYLASDTCPIEKW